MSKSTLVVVDMQYGFNTALEELTILGCQEQIKIAMRNNSPIVFVEYGGHRETLFELTQLTVNYSNKFVVDKYWDDGGYEVRNVISKFNLSQNIKICGVNADCCVLETARFLSAHYKVELIATAVNSCLGLTNLPNVFDQYRKLNPQISILYKTRMLERIKKKLAA